MYKSQGPPPECVPLHITYKRLFWPLPFAKHVAIKANGMGGEKRHTRRGKLMLEIRPGTGKSVGKTLSTQAPRFTSQTRGNVRQAQLLFSSLPSIPFWLYIFRPGFYCLLMLMKNISNCAAGIKGGYPFITRQAFKISSTTTIHPTSEGTISGIKLKPRPFIIYLPVKGE